MDLVTLQVLRCVRRCCDYNEVYESSHSHHGTTNIRAGLFYTNDAFSVKEEENDRCLVKSL